MFQEALEHEQAEVLGRSRYERQPTLQGYCQGYADGTVKTAAGVRRLPRPQVRGLREPSRSQLWAALGRTSAVPTRLIVEMDAGGRAQRDIASAWEKALGQCVVSQSAVSEIPDRLRHAYEAWRTRDLRGFALASLLIETVYEPLRRWGSQTGVLCGWGICVDGRKVFLTRATAHSASYDSCLEVWRDLVKRGLQTSVTSTTDGAPGLLQAVDSRWPRALRMRCWFHTMQHLPQNVPPQAWSACKAVVADRREAPTCEEGQRRGERLLAESQGTFPEACRCLADDTEASLQHLKVPPRHLQSVRTSHLAERAFEEARRRTQVMPPLGDEARWVQLVFAVLMRVSARWGKQPLSEFE